MSTGNKREAVERAAAHWLQKRDAEAWSDADEQDFKAWLEVDTDHRVAYLRLEAAWNEMNRLQAVGAGYPRGMVPTPEQLISPGSEWSERSPAPRRSRPTLKLATLAASLLLATGLALAVYFGTDYFRGAGYSTQIGAVTAVPLKDGTNVVLSTASRIRVQLKATERRVDLAQGEAFFEVVHDARRPFIVHAGDKRITAIGTKFAVRRDGDDVRVVVTEGKVRLDDGASAEVLESRPAHANAVPATPLLLTAGTVVTSTAAGVHVQQLAPDEAEEQLSWRQGFVVFHETALADAVAEFNRYNDRKIVIVDPTLAAIRLSGKFRSTNIDTLVSLLQRTYGIHATEDTDRIMLNGTE